jgi:hypothetical protein
MVRNVKLFLKRLKLQYQHKSKQNNAVKASNKNRASFGVLGQKISICLRQSASVPTSVKESCPSGTTPSDRCRSRLDQMVILEAIHFSFSLFFKGYVIFIFSPFSFSSLFGQQLNSMKNFEKILHWGNL